MKSCWTLQDIPDLTGKVALVTGGNRGLGYKSALELARAGCRVFIGCRDLDAGHTARQRIVRELPAANIEVLQLDLADVASIAHAAAQLIERIESLDLLLNNAGLVNLEHLTHTPQGEEMHFAVNHLGHFALTGLIMPLLCASRGARVVTLSSGGYKAGVIDFDDIQWRRRSYHRLKAYGDSKLANVLFCLELQRRCDSAGVELLSCAAHPGLTATERQQSIGVGGWLSRVMATPVERGCLPQLRAATDPMVEPGSYFGPRFLLWGAPVAQSLNAMARDVQLAEQLWDYSESVTGVRFF
ncbi:MAG: oxidoreductase [Pseudomonadales bacterium]